MEMPPSESPPPPSVPAGWMDDPEQPDMMRYWDGSAWTDNRSPKPPTADPGSNRPQSLRGGMPAPTPTAVALDGWVDVKISTVPGVVINSTKNNFYKVFASGFNGEFSVKTNSGGDIATYAHGTYRAEFTMGFKTVRKTPTWAIVVGIITTLLFLIGFLFFFVKENRQVETRILTVTLDDGRSFSGPFADQANWK